MLMFTIASTARVAKRLADYKLGFRSAKLLAHIAWSLALPINLKIKRGESYLYHNPHVVSAHIFGDAHSRLPNFQTVL